ncbi:MAG: SDR family NAD(P)-dependent oxidoreductase, partial [Gammaproteobacteria bacterium]
MNSVLITGSNRGLGLEWAHQYAQNGWKVYATCRYPDQADALRQLTEEYSNVTVSQLDVTLPEQLETLVTQLDTAPI